MAHYTTDEALEIAPRFIEALRRDLETLERAFKRGDWHDFYKQCQNVQWDATNLKGIARDEMEKANRREAASANAR